MSPSVARVLRSAAELATAAGRATGGLLFGCGWADEMGTYLVIDHYLEAGPGEDSGGRSPRDGDGDFTLTEASLRLLREDAARMHPDSVEVGWWRSRDELGEFGPGDLVTQGELVGPDGVGLLVYGSGIYWGTAYLGPDGRAPDSAGTLAAVQDPDPGPPTGPDLAPPPETDIAPPLDIAEMEAGEGLRREPILTQTGPRRRRAVRRTAAPGSRRATASGYRRARRRGAGLADASAAEPEGDLPADAQLVVGALMVVIIAAAVIIGFLASSVLVAVIIGAVGVLLVMGAVWMSHRY
jgi:hypothetical protein